MKDFSKATDRYLSAKFISATPRPWILDDRKENLVGINGNRVRLYGLQVSHAIQPDDESKQNADLIVTAVNNFDKMKELLESIYLELKHHPSNAAREHYKSFVEKAEQLLESLK